MTQDKQSGPRKYKFGFVLSTALGNQTRYQNLRLNAEKDPDIEFTWAPVSHYIPEGGPKFFDKLPRSLRARAIVFYQSRAVLDRLGELDAIFIHMYEIDILLALRSYLFRSPLRVISTDDAPAVDPERYPFHPVDRRKAPWRKRVRLAIDLWRSRRADYLIPFSTWAAGLHVNGAGKPESLVTPIHVGIDLSLWPDRDRSIAAPATDRRIKLLFVGGEFIRKGGDLVLETFRKHFSERAELHLVTKSALPELPPHTYVYRDMEANDPRLAELYRKADLFVLPTTSDLSSWVTLEAMASGCPAIVTPVGGIGDLVKPGVTGLLVQPGDAEGLRAAIESLIDDPERCREMGIAARRYVEQDFDAAKNVARMMSIMKALVDARRTGPVRSTA